MSPELSPNDRRAIKQYLSRYAEPEHGYAAQLEGRYDAAVVVPLHAEDPDLLELWLPVLTGPSSPGRRGGTPCLLIAVVNARQDAPQGVIDANEELMRAWRLRATKRCVLDLTKLEDDRGRALATAELLTIPSSRGDELHVLLLDASSGERGFPPKQGVGLARRMGFDVAVALADQGRLVARYVGSTDGDVQLPNGYLAALHRPGAGGVASPAALVFPFEHFGGLSEGVLEATEFVELSWRYYVLGIAWAGSPFAYHSVGSCLAIEVAAYARVRGFPIREAGEDFHVLAKLVKLGTIESLKEPVFRIAARRSERVPFGTGPAVARVLSGFVGRSLRDGTVSSPLLTLHDPRVFVGLRYLLESLCSLSSGVAPGPPPSELSASVRAAWDQQWSRWHAHLAPRLQSCPSSAHRLHRIFEAFDPLATLRAIHAFRDAGFRPVPWQQAAQQAPFLRAPSGASVGDVLILARELEAALPSLRGLGTPRAANLRLPSLGARRSP